MKRLFCKISDYLINSCESTPKGNALKRLNTLSGLISGMIRKGKSSLPAIGSGISKNIDANSKTISAKRFIENKWTDFNIHFLPYLKCFLTGILSCFEREIIFVIDGSQTGKDNAALMISLVWKKRGIPICWFVKQGGKGHFKSEDHLIVLKQAIAILEPLLPRDISVVLLGDGEFDGAELQALCREVGWNYVLRTACDTVLYKDGEQFHARDIYPIPEHNCSFIEQVEFTLQRFKYVNFTCWHDTQRHEEPIFLISNLLCPGEIIEFYDQRYSIECLFKDLKSTSFNIHKTRLKKPEDVFNLLIIASMAFILVVFVSINYDSETWRKKVQRVRKDRKVLSFFTFAYNLLEHFIVYEIDFCINSKFSKNFL